MSNNTKVLSKEYLASVIGLISEGKEFNYDSLVGLGDMIFDDGQVVEAKKVGQALNAINSGVTLGEFEGNNKHSLEAVYSLARSFIVGDQYEKAKKLLLYLCQQDHLNARNWLALGKLQVLQGSYTESLSSFFMGSMFSDDDPEFTLCSAEAQFRMRDYDAASAGVDYAESLSKLSDVEQPEIKKRIKVLRAAINRKIEKNRNSRNEAGEQND